MDHMRLSERATTARLRHAVRWYAITGEPQNVRDLIIAELGETRRPKHLSDDAAALWEAGRVRRARVLVQNTWAWSYLSETQLDRLTLQLAKIVRDFVAQIRLAALSNPARPISTAATANILLVEALFAAPGAPPARPAINNPEGLAA